MEEIGWIFDERGFIKGIDREKAEAKGAISPDDGRVVDIYKYLGDQTSPLRKLNTTHDFAEKIREDRQKKNEKPS